MVTWHRETVESAFCNRTRHRRNAAAIRTILGPGACSPRSRGVSLLTAIEARFLTDRVSRSPSLFLDGMLAPMWAAKPKSRSVRPRMFESVPWQVLSPSQHRRPHQAQVRPDMSQKGTLWAENLCPSISATGGLLCKKLCRQPWHAFNQRVPRPSATPRPSTCCNGVGRVSKGASADTCCIITSFTTCNRILYPVVIRTVGIPLYETVTRSSHRQPEVFGTCLFGQRPTRPRPTLLQIASSLDMQQQFELS